MVFVVPPYLKEYADLGELDPNEHFLSPLSAIIEKALTINNNIVMLLPPNINTERLAAVMAETLEQSPRGRGSCSFEIEKLYFMSSLKYLLVLYGPLVNKEVTLSDELSFIYKMLRGSGEGKFEHKKLIKEIRERHGMLALLRLIHEYCEMEEKGEASAVPVPTNDHFANFVQQR